MKELEALEKIGKTVLHTYETNGNIMAHLLKGSEEYQVLLKALTPPTADEVCEKLSEYLHQKVIYVKDVKKFAYYENNKNGYVEICYYGETLASRNSVRFSFPLPLYIASNIIKFYEGLTNE